LNTIESWLDDETISETPITKCSISLLQDFYLNPSIIEFPPEHIAAACLCLTFQIYGLKVPGMDDTDTWFKAFVPDMTIEQSWEIIDQILKAYEVEEDIYK
jgi:cyclin-Q